METAAAATVILSPPRSVITAVDLRVEFRAWRARAFLITGQAAGPISNPKLIQADRLDFALLRRTIGGPAHPAPCWTRLDLRVRAAITPSCCPGFLPLSVPGFCTGVNRRRERFCPLAVIAPVDVSVAAAHRYRRPCPARRNRDCRRDVLQRAPCPPAAVEPPLARAQSVPCRTLAGAPRAVDIGAAARNGAAYRCADCRRR